jgi:hypothetical protein
LPNDTNSKRFRAQAKNNAATLREVQRAARQRDQTKQREKFLKELRREEERNLRSILKHVRATGIYNPKSDELTSYRKKRLRAVKKEYGRFLGNKDFKFIAAPKEAIDRANSLEFKTTKKGLFAPTQGFKSVSLKKDDKRGEYYIYRGKKIKMGERAGKRYTAITPLVSVDELASEKVRLAEYVRKLEPLKGNERFAFVVKEQGFEGYSHSTFTHIDDIVTYLDRYNKTLSARVNFLRHIEIVKTGSAKVWFAEHPVKAVKRHGRRIHTSARPFKKRG